MKKSPIHLNAAIVFAMATAGASAASAEHVKIAFIDTLSGAFAAIGENEMKSYQMFAKLANQNKWAGDHTIEFVPYDNKGSVQESLTQLKTVIDQGFRYIVQGNGSGVALALVDAIEKHNERNPGKEVVFLNHAAIDPDLTNSKCSFWHFRFDANTDMKMEVLSNHLAKDRSIKKAFIIGQNYAHGHQVSRIAKEHLQRKRPDVQIVGDDFHPTAQVRDFSPYVAKIKASGADTVITGNWGADLALLVKAAKEIDLKANFYTFYANTTGVPTAMGAAGAERVKMVYYWHPNTEQAEGRRIYESFKKTYNDDFYISSTHSIVVMLTAAMKAAGSAAPVPVAYALEGLKAQGLNGDLEMRKTDHQLQQPLYVMTWAKADGKAVKYDQENTGYGWRTELRVDPYVAAQPTSCQMKRPSRL